VYLLATLFLINGCNSNDTNSNKESEKPAHATDTVMLQQMKFTPGDLTAKVGDTIVWINNDLVDHNVTSLRANFFYSDTLKVGGSWKWVVTDSAAYMCSIHPSMLGKILLK
jgi:plastocyanin